MTSPKNQPSGDRATRLILRLTEPEAVHTHVDENDLALLEMDALSTYEKAALRQVLRSCKTCRMLASQVLNSDGLEPAHEPHVRESSLS